VLLEHAEWNSEEQRDKQCRRQLESLRKELREIADHGPLRRDRVAEITVSQVDR
jgi:hypothetical protein